MFWKKLFAQYPGDAHAVAIRLETGHCQVVMSGASPENGWDAAVFHSSVLDDGSCAEFCAQIAADAINVYLRTGQSPVDLLRKLTGKMEAQATARIALWSDGTWCWPDEIEEMLQFMSDDYRLADVPLGLDDEPDVSAAL